MKNEISSDTLVCAADIDISGVTPRTMIASRLESAASLLRNNEDGGRDKSALWRIEDSLKNLNNLISKE